MKKQDKPKDLQIHKTYLEALFNSVTEAIILHDNNDIVLDINDEFTRMFGYSREEAIGKKINELVATDGLKEDANRLSFKVLKGERVYVEKKRRRKDGSLIDVSILGAPIINENKEIGVYAIYRDISLRKNAQEELQVQKTYLEELFNSAPEAIILHDNHDIVMNVNDEFTNIFGYSRDEAIGKSINDLVASDKLRDDALAQSSIVLSGKRVNVETRRKRKNGSIFDVWILGAPIFSNDEQVGVYAIYRDISKRKKVEQEINLQKTYLEELFNSAPEAIILHDNNDIIVNVNREFTNVFGYSKDEVLGAKINDIVASKDLLEDAHLQSSAVLSGQKVNVETKRRRKDGSQFDVWILGAPIFNKYEQVGVYAIYRDITERKRAEEARIKSREQARMARDIQINFLPKSNPEIPGYDIAGINIPAMEVGGDYYDFIPLDDNRLAIGVGDVSGKGLPASLVMANLQATIRCQSLLNVSSKKCLESSNKLLFNSTDRRIFVSLFYGILDIKDHTLSFSNAGQNRPLLFSLNKKPLPLKTHDLVLGIKENVLYQMEKVKISPGEMLIIYTDGISESMNKKMEEFGEDRLLNIIDKNIKNSASKLVYKIIGAAKKHSGNAPQSDDMTLVVIKRNS